MTAGIRIVNEHSSVQIDENWKNYGFRQKFSATLTAYATSPPNPAGYNGAVYRVVVSGSPQLLVACRAATLMPVKMHCFYGGGTWTQNWLFLSPDLTTVTETVDFYVFDAMAGTYSNVGIEIFNAAGERVFHSDAPVMKVGSAASAGVQPCNTGFSGDAGHDYVPLILANPYVAELYVGSGIRVSSYALRTSGSSISASRTGLLGAVDALGVADLPGLYAAIDVTGLS